VGVEARVAGRAGALGELAATVGRLTEPRSVLRSVGLAAGGVGTAFCLAPRLGLRLMGLEAEGRGVSLLARLFASRDIVLGITLLRAAEREQLEKHWLEVVALFQVTDLAFSGALYRSGHLSRRAWGIVLSTATPTLVAALAGRLRIAG
jgi:hypothetical protein